MAEDRSQPSRWLGSLSTADRISAQATAPEKSDDEKFQQIATAGALDPRIGGTFKWYNNEGGTLSG